MLLKRNQGRATANFDGFHSTLKVLPLAVKTVGRVSIHLVNEEYKHDHDE